MPVWFLRHGESEANSNGLYAGSGDDSPLTERGRSQAHAAREYLPSEISWIVTSPLLRAVSTAEIVRDSLHRKVELEVDYRVCEYDMGRASGTPIRDISTTELVEKFGAEDPSAFLLRVMSALDELSQRPGTGIVVSHAGVARVLLARQGGLPSSDFRRVAPPRNAIPFLLQ